MIQSGSSSRRRSVNYAAVAMGGTTTILPLHEAKLKANQSSNPCGSTGVLPEPPVEPHAWGIRSDPLAPRADAGDDNYFWLRGKARADPKKERWRQIQREREHERDARTLGITLPRKYYTYSSP